MPKKIYPLLISLLILFVVACTAHIQYYSGPKLNKSEIALIHTSGMCRIYNIDGQPLTFYGGRQVIELKPGTYRLSIRVEDQESRRLNVIVHAGRVYKITSTGGSVFNQPLRIIDITSE